ncbi:MAG: hypothetical protein ACLQMF_09805 [Rectinemataceae bacterium]
MDEEQRRIDEKIVADYDSFCRKLKINSTTTKGLAAFKTYLTHGVKMPDEAIRNTLSRLNETFHFESHA